MGGGGGPKPSALAFAKPKPPHLKRMAQNADDADDSNDDADGKMFDFNGKENVLIQITKILKGRGHSEEQQLDGAKTKLGQITLQNFTFSQKVSNQRNGNC